MDKELLDKELDSLLAPRRGDGEIVPRQEWFINTTTGQAEVEPVPDEKPKRRAQPVQIIRTWGD